MKTPKTTIKYPINIKLKNNDRITKLGMLAPDRVQKHIMK